MSRPRPRSRVLRFAAPFLCLLVAACTSPQYARSADPLLDLRNPSLRADQRADAAREVWSEVESGLRDRDRTRAALKDLAWSRSTPPELRLTAVGLLMSDNSPEGEADSERLATLMLPNEDSMGVIRVLSAAAAQQGWTDVTPALIRSYARPGNVPDADRPERAALRSLHPNMPVERLVFEVMLAPGDLGTEAERALSWTDRVRADAWSLLSRLDPTGQQRRSLLASAAPSDDAGATLVEDLRAVDASLATLPATADELAWVRALRGRGVDADIAARNRAWWGETAGAIARLDASQRRGLELRHAEPIRWAAAHRPSWFDADRDALHAALAERLGGRDVRERREGVGVAGGGLTGDERLRDWIERLNWADLLTLLVVDDAVHDPGVLETLATQVELDRDDKSTEYGGVLEPIPDDADGAFRIVLFRPRQRDRNDDRRFVASEDMVHYSDRALAHYHQHVLSKRNGRFAGPSRADLAYAAASGRTCLVFTSVGGDRLNVDCYQPDGVVIDLGEIRLP